MALAVLGETLLRYYTRQHPLDDLALIAKFAIRKCPVVKAVKMMDPCRSWGSVFAIFLACLLPEGVDSMIDPAVMKQLDLPVPQRIHIPIHVNLLFIGFDKKFAHSPEVNFKNLQQWVEMNDGHKPFSGQHIRILSKTFSSSALFRDVQLEASSDIDYEFRVQLVEMSTLVHAALEAALKTFMRLEMMSSNSLYQVDPDKMATLFESLLHSLNLSDYYNVLVLNPGKLLAFCFPFFA